MRQYWEQGTHILLVDTGNSYKGLCDLIHQKTGGDDGIYFTYKENDPISFNPFFTEDYQYDIEKRDSIKTLILTPLEKGGRTAPPLGRGGTLECSQSVYRENKEEPEDKT